MAPGRSLPGALFHGVTQMTVEEWVEIELSKLPEMSDETETELRRILDLEPLGPTNHPE